MSGLPLKMDRLAITSALVFVLTISEYLLGDANRINCDSVYFGELHKSSFIECQVHHPKTDVYWFKGPETVVYPIISSEDGKVEWGRGYEDKYNLTDNKMLQIFDTEPEDEGPYTVRIYFTNFDYETETTEFRVYGRPDDRCARIDSCDSTCDNCRLNVTSSGELKCHMTGSRPRIDLQWIVTNQSGISFIHQEQVEQYDEVSGTFNITRTVTYTANDCGGTASLHCNASVSEHSFESLVEVHNRNVEIFSETCKYIISSTTKPPRKEERLVLWPFVMLPLVVLVVILVVCFIRWKKGRGLSSRTMESEEYTELKPSESDLNRQPPRQPPKPQDVKKELIKALIKHYEQFCFIKPLPWGEPIPIDALYTECECAVTTEKGTIHHTSEYLSAADFNFDFKRVFITADLGYGKTTFTQHLVKKWVTHETTVKEKEMIKTDHPVLIYFHLKEVTRSMVLSKVVQRMLPTGNNLTCSDIEGIFRSNECHILLDGLDELSMSSQAEATSEVSVNDTTELTIGNLLDNSINMDIYKHLRIWVTSREVDDMRSEFSLPYSKVKLLGFSRQQIIEYIHKSCKYYYEQTHIPEMPLVVDDAYDDISSDNATTYKSEHPLLKTTDGIEKPSSDKHKISEDICATQSDSDVVNVSETKENKNQMHVVNENTEEINEPTVHTKLLENAEQDSNKRPSDGESNEDKRKKDEMSTGTENKATASARGTIENDKTKVLNLFKLLEERIINFIEVNEIISIFSETPLLQIMIIHIITCRILDPTGRYKEMNINKLTTIIRLVITCLESRYVQKIHKDSIKLDIQTLESKLGEIAFKNKLKVTLGQKEFWKSKLGKEEDVKTALEIGLLKYSKGVASGSIQLEELAFSSHSGIEFYHELFKEYLAAQYISENKTKWKWLDEFIKGSGDEATVRLLQFMFGMNNPKLDRAYETLVDEKKMWNNLIDCIYEVGDPEKKRSMLVDLKNTAKKGGFNMNLNIKYLERKHHSVAVTDFCKACNEHQISIKRMTFREACAIDFLKKVTLPSLEMLTFLEMKINETQFASILTNLSIRKCPKILLFVSCEIPKTLTGEDLTKVALAMKNEKMKIYSMKTTDQKEIRVPVFNCQAGIWEREFFPKKV